MKTNYISALVLAAMAFASCENKATEKIGIEKSTISIQSMNNATIGDDEFINKTYNSNITIIKLGEMASKKATSKEVKAYADELVKQHKKANTEIEKIAKDKNVKLSVNSEMMMKTKMKDLESKTGTKFDQAFVDNSSKELKKDADRYQTASRELTDPKLKQYATSTLTTVKMEQDKATKLTQTMETTKETSKEKPANKMSY